MAKLTKQDRKLILKGLQLMANELLKDVSEIGNKCDDKILSYILVHE